MFIFDFQPHDGRDLHNPPTFAVTSDIVMTSEMVRPDLPEIDSCDPQ